MIFYEFLSIFSHSCIVFPPKCKSFLKFFGFEKLSFIVFPFKKTEDKTKKILPKIMNRTPATIKDTARQPIIKKTSCMIIFEFSESKATGSFDSLGFSSSS